MILAVLAMVGLTSFQPTPINDLQAALNMFGIPGTAINGGNFNYGPRIDMRSPLSGSVLVDQAIRAGRVRIPFVYGRQPYPQVLTCSPIPCIVPNVQASEGGSPVNEDPITENPTRPKDLLTGGNDYNCGSSLQGFYASSNGGTTWNHTCMGVLAGNGGDGDPNVGYNLHGTAFIAGIDTPGGNVTEIALETSANNGMTWSAPTVAVTGISPYTFVDKPWMQIDVTPTSPRKNTIYISSTDFDQTTNNSSIAVGHSTNNGATWHNVMVDAQVFPIIDQFSDLAIGSDGTVYLSWMRCSATGPNGNCGATRAMILFSKSTDGGKTWSAPVTVAMPNLAPDPCGAFYGCLPNTGERVSDVPAMDVDRSGGPFNNRLYMTFYSWTGKKMQVDVAHSATGGATWSHIVRVDATAANDEFFPWLSLRSNGTVGVTWLDRRLDPSNLSYDSFSTTSTNGGLSFAANTRLSTASSNPNNDGFGGSFMGDYTGNIWDGDTLLTSWMDTRSGISQDEVGGLKI
jgi:hypothetical protein